MVSVMSHCRLLKTNINHTYYIKAGSEAYVLRVHDHRLRSLQQVTAEVQFLNRMKDLVSLSYPIADRNAAFVGEINAPEGIRYVVLYSFAKGRKMRHPSPETCFKIGELVGRLHEANKDQVIDNGREYTSARLAEWAYKEVANYTPEDTDEMKFLKSSAAALAAAFGKYPLSCGIVHLDIWYDNMSIQEDGTITLFDFDNLGNGWLILDAGYYCMQLFYTCMNVLATDPGNNEYEEKKAAFINGYRSVMPLPDRELELIPYAGLAIWIYYLGLQARAFNNMGNLFFSENYVRMMVGRVKEWLKYNHVEIPQA